MVQSVCPTFLNIPLFFGIADLAARDLKLRFKAFCSRAFAARCGHAFGSDRRQDLTVWSKGSFWPALVP
jgi:hypothetical protein